MRQPGFAARAAHLLIVYVFGSIALDVADLAAAPVRAGYISTEQYLWGLHRVLDGITTTTARRRKAPASAKTKASAAARPVLDEAAR